MNLNLNTFLFDSIENCIEDNDGFVNLFTKTLKDFNKFELESISEKILITEELEFRPHLLSSSFFNGDESYTDVICYVNGISNPLNLIFGSTILVPNKEYLDSLRKIDDNDLAKKENLAKKLLNNKFSEKDKNRMLSKIEISEIRTPNITSGPNIEIKRDEIELGVNISKKKCRDNLTETQILSERIKEAIRNKF
jgi:hypothetical protein